MPLPPSRSMGLNGVFYPTQLLDLHFDEYQLCLVLTIHIYFLRKMVTNLSLPRLFLGVKINFIFPLVYFSFFYKLNFLLGLIFVFKSAGEMLIWVSRLNASEEMIIYLFNSVL